MFYTTNKAAMVQARKPKRDENDKSKGEGNEDTDTYRLLIVMHLFRALGYTRSGS